MNDTQSTDEERIERIYDHEEGDGRMVEYMSKEELMKISVEEFSRLQDWMLASEKDSEAYRGMKKRYDELKIILASLSVNITELDKIKG